MRSRVRRLPSPALVIATIALVLGAGGSAVATGLITGSQIAKGTIQLSNLSPQARLALEQSNGSAGSIGRAQAAAAPPAISNAYYLTRTTAVNPLPHQATTVATLTGLPAGKYVFTGDVAAVNFGTNDYVRCGIRAQGKSFGGSTAFVGPSAGATVVADITTTAPVVGTATFSAALVCSHDNPGNGPYVESIRLWGIQVTALSARTSSN